MVIGKKSVVFALMELPVGSTSMRNVWKRQTRDALEVNGLNL